MTPSDILNKTFPRGMNGYKADEVNAFLSEVAAEFKIMAQERADAQNKLEVLADKLEEYRSDEESLRAALIGAQKLGDSVVKEARKKAEAIIAEASHEADSIVGDAKRNMDAEAYALSKMKLEVSKFRTLILSMYKKQVELINAIPFEEGSVHLPQPEKAGEPPAATESARDDSVVDVSVITSGDEEIKLEYERISDESEAAQRQSRFGDLRFGEKYDLKRNE